MPGWFEKGPKSAIDARLKRLNHGLSCVMTICCIGVLLPALARLEIARYAFWVWLSVTIVALLVQLATALAIRSGIASKDAREDNEPSNLVGEAWEEAVGCRPSINATIVEDACGGEWRKAHGTDGRTIVYRIGK